METEAIVTYIPSLVKNSHERDDNSKKSIFQNNALIAEVGDRIKITKEFILQILRMNGAIFDQNSNMLTIKNYNIHISKYMSDKYMNSVSSELLLLHSKFNEFIPLALDLSTIESVSISTETFRIFDVDCKSYEDKQFILLNLVSFNKVYTIIINQNLHEDDSLRLEICSEFLKMARNKKESEFEILFDS